MIPFSGFTPDADPTSPGCLVEVDQMVPTDRGGMAASARPSPIAIPALAGPCLGAASMARLDDSRRIFAGTASALFELSGGVWVSRGTGFAAPKWRFAQLGDVSLASDGVSPIQESITAAFTAVPTAPSARFLVTAQNFVLAFYTNDATNGIRPDGWACSGLAAYQTWGNNPAAQAAFGRLFGTPGEIRGARALGESVVVYKERSIFLGQYSGPPEVWAWQRVSGEVGAVSNESIVDTGTAHLFVGADDFWVYDGSMPQSIGAPIRRWFFANSEPSQRRNIVANFDRFNGLVYWYFAGLGSSVLNRALVYNLRTMKWGAADSTIQAALVYSAPAVTWDQQFAAIGNLWSAWPNAAYEDLFATSGGVIPAVFDRQNRLCTLTGAPMGSSLKTGEFGDDDAASVLLRVRPRFLVSPQSGTAQGYAKKVLGDVAALGDFSTLSEGRFDMTQGARWHSVGMAFIGPVEVTGFSPELRRAGRR